VKRQKRRKERRHRDSRTGRLAVRSTDRVCINRGVTRERAVVCKLFLCDSNRIDSVAIYRVVLVLGCILVIITGCVCNKE
jgi:hypothetical protein